MVYANQCENLYVLSPKLLKKEVLYLLCTVKVENVILIVTSSYIFNVFQYVTYLKKCHG
jgi:hypothetical protein